MKRFLIIFLFFNLSALMYSEYNIYGTWKEHGRSTATIIFYRTGRFGIKLKGGGEAKGSFIMEQNIITMTFRIKNRYFKATYDILRKYPNKFIARVVTINQDTGNVVQNEIVTVKRIARSGRILG